MKIIKIGERRHSDDPGDSDPKMVVAFSETLVYEVLSSAIKEITVSSGDKGIKSCDITISANDPCFYDNFDHGVAFNLYFQIGETQEHHEGLFMVDNVKGEKPKDKDYEIVVRSRSLTSPLMDYGIHKGWNTSLSDLIKAICGSQNIRAQVDLVDKAIDPKVEAWIDTYSCYGALRLLGLTFDLQVKDQNDGTIRMVSRKRLVEELSQKKPAIIDRDKVLSERKVSGRLRRD